MIIIIVVIMIITENNNVVTKKNVVTWGRGGLKIDVPQMPSDLGTLLLPRTELSPLSRIIPGLEEC